MLHLAYYVRLFLLSCMEYSCRLILFFFFKQKTAYEMRISDWSSDVCSSDLQAHRIGRAEKFFHAGYFSSIERGRTLSGPDATGARLTRPGRRLCWQRVLRASMKVGVSPKVTVAAGTPVEAPKHAGSALDRLISLFRSDIAAVNRTIVERTESPAKE